MSRVYVYGKFQDAIGAMAASHKSLQERLLIAARGLITLDATEDLPKQLRADFAWIGEQLNTDAAIGDEGTMAATAAKMSDNRAMALAEKLVELESSLFTEWYM